MKSGVSYNKEDPNYDLFKESIRVSAKRLFPNFSNLDAPYNAQYYVEGDKDTEAAYMGCVQGSEVVTYKINGELYVESIQRMYQRLSGRDVENIKTTHYIDTSNKDVEIYDSNSGTFVKNLKVIVNPNRNNWKLVKFTDGRSLVATEDHPLPVIGKGRIFVSSIQVGDSIPVTYSQYSEVKVKPKFSTNVAWLLGLLLCDSAYANNVMLSLGLNETDIVEKVRTAVEELGFNISIKEQHRGVKGNYFDVNIKCGNKLKYFREYLEEIFGGKQKMLRQIPNEVFSWSNEYKAAFLAGIMDADGYVSHHRDRDSTIDTSRFSLGSVNKELALQQVALIQSLGCSAKYYRNHYSSTSDKVRYVVECSCIPEVTDNMSSAKKLEIGDIKSAKLSIPKYATVESIEDIDIDEPSFDVETASDRFDVSGILSHNCRTRVMANVYDPKYEKVTGRGNLSFTTINLPRLGLKSNGDIDTFFNLLDGMLDLVHSQLLARFKVQCRKHPRNYPFLMGQGVWKDSDNLGPDDDITEILKHGTLTVGFIGLAECLVALTGKHHGESEESQELGLRIIGHMREATDKWSQDEHMNYSVIATPAEGLSGRFVRIDKKKFGIIPGVTDRDYYTNSMHVPVYFNISAYKKIQIEAPYHALCNGGHISYIELDGDPSKNLDAFEKVVRWMHDAGIGYGAINHPVDRDPVCGYSGIIDEVCPRCGRREGQPMTVEMWRKIHGYAAAPNAETCGTCGNPLEEADRLTNPVE